MASRCRFGAFVYTVAPWAWVVGGLGIAIVYTNGRIGPLLTGLGRLCTLLGCCAVVNRCEDAIVYTNRWKWPLRTVLERLCTLLRRESRYEYATRAASGGTSASAATVCRRRPLAGPSRLVGKTGSERAAPLPGWHLRRGINPHEPPKSPKFASSRPMPRDRHGGFTTDNVPHVTVSPLVDFTWEWLGIVVDVERGGCNPALDGHGKHTPRAPAWCL